MTRTAITVNKTARTNTPPTNAAATITTIDSSLVTAGVNISDFFNVEEPRLRVYNSAVSAKTITLVAPSTSANGAIKAGIGNYTLSVPAGETHIIDQIESARFIQSGGALYINLQTGFTGSIDASGTAKGIG